MATWEAREMRSLKWLAGCLVLAGLLLSGPAMRADEQKTDKDADKKEEKKKEEKKDRLDVPFPDLEKLLEALGGGLGDEPLKELREQMERMREAMKQMQKGRGGFGVLPLFPPVGGGGMGTPVVRRSLQESRLGAKLSEPTAALIDQLDLPKDQGLVLDEVGGNSAAAKAGLKAYDVLLEVDGKAVSRKKGEFDKLLSAVKADKAVDVVVMRKGKKETLEGLKLPEAKESAPAPRNLP